LIFVLIGVLLILQQINKIGMSKVTVFEKQEKFKSNKTNDIILIPAQF